MRPRRVRSAHAVLAVASLVSTIACTREADPPVVVVAVDGGQVAPRVVDAGAARPDAGAPVVDAGAAPADAGAVAAAPVDPVTAQIEALAVVDGCRSRADCDYAPVPYTSCGPNAYGAAVVYAKPTSPVRKIKALLRQEDARRGAIRRAGPVLTCSDGIIGIEIQCIDERCVRMKRDQDWKRVPRDVEAPVRAQLEQLVRVDGCRSAKDCDVTAVVDGPCEPDEWMVYSRRSTPTTRLAALLSHQRARFAAAPPATCPSREALRAPSAACVAGRCVER